MPTSPYHLEQYNGFFSGGHLGPMGKPYEGFPLLLPGPFGALCPPLPHLEPHAGFSFGQPREPHVEPYEGFPLPLPRFFWSFMGAPFGALYWVLCRAAP